jgi:hypothetical protein
VPVLEDELDVLAGAVAEGLGGGQLQAQHHHIRRSQVQADDTRGHLDHGVIAQAHHLAGFDDHIGLGRGAAG